MVVPHWRLRCFAICGRCPAIACCPVYRTVLILLQVVPCCEKKQNTRNPLRHWWPQMQDSSISKCHRVFSAGASALQIDAQRYAIQQTRIIVRTVGTSAAKSPELTAPIRTAFRRAGDCRECCNRLLPWARLSIEIWGIAAMQVPQYLKLKPHAR